MSDFETFVRQQQEPVRRFLLSLCAGDRATADDLAQEAFIKAFVSFHTFASRSKMSTWLFRIAYNTFIDYTRKARPERAELSEAAMALSGDQADGRFENEALYRAIARLSEDEKAVTLLFYMEDKSLKEISAITGIKTNTIKSHLSRARNHLKEYLSLPTSRT